MNRALRRHRKRLARIVVDHWIYKARKRLFVLRLQRVLQKHRKRLCFKTWKEFAVLNMREREKHQAARNFNMKSKKKRHFDVWITFYKIEHKRRAAMEKLSTLARRRMSTGFFRLWQQQTQQQIETQRKRLIAEHFWSLSLLSMCFMHWQLGVRISQRKKYLNRFALGFWAKRKLSLSLLAFKKAVCLRRSILMMITNRNQRLLSSLLKHWHAIALEADMKELQRQALSASKKALLLKSFRTLQNYVLKKNSSRRFNQIAICFHHDQCMYRTYKAWHDYITCRQEKRRLGVAALTHLKRKLMRSVFRKWHLYTQSNKAQDSVRRVYEEKLCSRCMRIWKQHVVSQRRVRVCTENQALCRLSHVVALLQSQNRLLRRGFLKITRNKQFSAKRGIKTFLISRACVLYRRCIQELTHAAQKYIEISKEKRCHVCTEHVSCNTDKIARAMLPIGQSMANACEMSAGRSRILCDNEGRSFRASSTDPIIEDAKEEESGLLKTNSALLGSCIERITLSEKLYRAREGKSDLGSSRGRLLRRTRLPPRRPLYLNDPFAVERCVSDSKLIREELIWTEGLLCSFDKLKEELHQKEAELAALRGMHVPGDKLQSDRMKFLEEKIMVLQERQAILLPMVEGLSSRADALQRSFCKGTQILHLD